MEDAGKLINDQNAQKRGFQPELGTYSYEEYLRYSELEEWMASTADSYPDHTELTNLATTYDGRTLWGFHMGDNNHTGPKKKVFMGKEYK